MGFAAMLSALLFVAAPDARAKPVDHYVLALSWSPSFCAASDAGDEPMQCGGHAPFAFVVHGLWPQYSRGWPQYCPAQERWIPENMISAILPLMPSKRLVIHEWRKHGTCSGLTMGNYFALIRRLFAKVRIPDRYRAPADAVTARPAAIMSDFIEANPGLKPSMIGLACRPSGQTAALTEVRICFSPSGEFTQCSPRSRSDCQAETLVLPPVTDMGGETR
ncbi:MAG: ribonuclease T2 family protein [Aestuariivirgaceae bacterium]